MAISRYFPYAFGVSADDLTAIPDSAAIDGSVSYQDGWTQPYEYNLLTNPAALPIPRGQMNQLFYDITLNIKEYQEYGTPQWVVGNTVQYPIYARVYYSGAVYENQVSNNTVTPGTDSTWRTISGNVGGLPIGTIIDFGGAVVPVDFLACDGSAYSRSTYAALLAAIIFQSNGTTINGVNTLTGLTTTATLYVGAPIEGFGIPSGTTVASITSSTSITMSQNATASATVLVTFYSWGNGDGSTTFNVPDLRRRVCVGGAGTGSAVLGNKVGQIGGEEAHMQQISEMPSHDHSGSGMIYQSFNAGGGGTAAVETPGGNSGTYPVQVAAQGGGVAFNIMQPSAITLKCIKYQ